MTASNERDPDRELTDYLDGRHAVSGLYRKVRPPRPSSLDEQVLAYADSQMRPRRFVPWRPALALAATVVIGVAVSWKLWVGPGGPGADAGGDSALSGAPMPGGGSGGVPADGLSPLGNASQKSTEAAEAILAEEARPQQSREHAAPPPMAAFSATPPRLATRDRPAAAAADEVSPSPPLVSDDAQIERLLERVRGLPAGTIVQGGEALDGESLAAQWRARWHKNRARCALASDFVEHCAMPGLEDAVVTLGDSPPEALRPVLHRWMRQMEHPVR